MKLRGVRRSRNVVDQRGQRRAGRGGGGGLKVGGFGLIVILLLGYVFGVDVTPLLQGGGGVSVQSEQRAPTPAEDRAATFASQVLTTTEQVWAQVFPDQLGRDYTAPQLVLFSGAVQSACGGASASSGPFYCPADKRAYLDTAFFAVMEQRLGARGDFAAAYVIAHEVAHHVQNELGILGQANAIRAQSSQTESNAISVRIELQADCLSGVWASFVEGMLEPGDLDEALNAAKRIGDDYLQRQAGQRPNPHTFTHGTSAQRQSWFQRGYRAQDVQVCDTFGAKSL